MQKKVKATCMQYFIFRWLIHESCFVDGPSSPPKFARKSSPKPAEDEPVAPEEIQEDSAAAASVIAVKSEAPQMPANNNQLTAADDYQSQAQDLSSTASSLVSGQPTGAPSVLAVSENAIELTFLPTGKGELRDIPGDVNYFFLTFRSESVERLNEQRREWEKNLLLSLERIMELLHKSRLLLSSFVAISKLLFFHTTSYKLSPGDWRPNPSLHGPFPRFEGHIVFLKCI